LPAVLIHKHDSHGARKVSYPGDVVSHGAREILVRAEWRFPKQELPYATLVPGDVFLETFYFDRWYNVFEIRSAAGELKGWYANITRPSYFVAEESAAGAQALIWEDLELDLWMSPAGDLLMLDEDEFAAADLPPAERAAALGAVAVAHADLRDRWRAHVLAQLRDQLIARGWRLATAESCTGGLLAHVVTDQPGISRVYLGGTVAYDNAVKIDALGVREATLQAHGAVSAETALEMARGARARHAAEVGVSTTGVAGPGGGSPEKPVGLVYIAVSTPAGDFVERHVWPHDRIGNKHASVDQALRMLNK
jgi:nicotinamide-nucleotide amidase